MKRVLLFIASRLLRLYFKASWVFDIIPWALPWAMDTLAAGAHAARLRARGGA